jgi:aminoglycoside phosphotransferase (APT) family kinase protein
VDVRDVGLDRFGRPSGFYDRQLTTLTDLIRLQGAAMDVETGKVVGEIPGLNEILRFLRTTQPKDRTTIIHGDYKIDNLVFHPTKPEVIGILEQVPTSRRICAKMRKQRMIADRF